MTDLTEDQIRALLEGARVYTGPSNPLFIAAPDLARQLLEALRENAALRACVQRLADGAETDIEHSQWIVRRYVIDPEANGGDFVFNAEPMTPAEAVVMREVLNR